jgi:hypothetical protein
VLKNQKLKIDNFQDPVIPSPHYPCCRMAEIHTVMESVMRVQSFIIVHCRSGREGKELELVRDTGD